jgi:hypothetical protein
MSEDDTDPAALRSCATPGPARGKWVSRSEIGAIIFTAAYLLVSVAAAVIVKNQEFIFYLCVMGVLIAVVMFLHVQVGLTAGAIWGLSLWGAAHMAGGLLPIPDDWPQAGESHVLYNLWLIPGRLKYDQVVHAYGFAVVTWVLWQCLARALNDRGAKAEPTIGLLTLCAAGGMGFGALNETVEFMAVLTLPGTNVGGYVNTGWDLVANSVGCVVAASAIRLLTKPR